MGNEAAQILRSSLLLLAMLPVVFLDVKLRSETDEYQRILRQGDLFFCADTVKDSSVKVDSISTLFARSDLGNVPIIIFETKIGGITPAIRCKEIANRFKSLSKRNEFTYLTWKRKYFEKGKSTRVITLSKYEGDAFKDMDYFQLFTLKPSDRPHEAIATLKGILSSSGGKPYRN